MWMYQRISCFASTIPLRIRFIRWKHTDFTGGNRGLGNIREVSVRCYVFFVIFMLSAVKVFLRFMSTANKHAFHHDFHIVDPHAYLIYIGN